MGGGVTSNNIDQNSPLTEHTDTGTQMRIKAMMKEQANAILYLIFSYDFHIFSSRGDERIGANGRGDQPCTPPSLPHASPSIQANTKREADNSQ